MDSETSPISPQMLVATLALADVLNKSGIEYALIGGLATGKRTHPRATRDIDVLLSVPQLKLPAVLDALAERGFTFEQFAVIREWIQHHMVVLSYHGIRIDWLKAIIPAYQEVLARASEETWQGQSIRVASVEGLILMKLMADRTQDWVDIENLVAVQRERLDLQWLQTQWETLGDVADPQWQHLLEVIEKMQATKLD